MTPIFIVKYSKTARPYTVAFTYSLEEARDICSREETHGKTWFYGFTKEQGHSKANVNILPSVSGMLRDINNNPGKKLHAR